MTGTPTSVRIDEPCGATPRMVSSGSSGRLQRLARAIDVPGEAAVAGDAHAEHALAAGAEAAMKVSRAPGALQLGARIVEQDAARLRRHEVVGALQDLAQCPSSRTSKRSCRGPRRARTKKREISSGDSVRIGPVGVAGFGTETSSVRTRAGTPASRGISVGRSGSLTRDDYITFPTVLRCPGSNDRTFTPEPATIPVPSPRSAAGEG